MEEPGLSQKPPQVQGKYLESARKRAQKIIKSRYNETPQEYISRKLPMMRRRSEIYSSMEKEIIDLLLYGKGLPRKYRKILDVFQPSKSENSFTSTNEVTSIIRSAAESLIYPKIEAAINDALDKVIDHFKLSFESIYNQVCDKCTYDYREIHQALQRQGFPKDALRQYKKRRMKKTADYRGEIPSSYLHLIEKTLKWNNYRMPPKDLKNATQLDDASFEAAIEILKKRKSVAATKEKVNGKYRDVVVLTTNT